MSADTLLNVASGIVVVLALLWAAWGMALVYLDRRAR